LETKSRCAIGGKSRKRVCGAYLFANQIDSGELGLSNPILSCSDGSPREPGGLGCANVQRAPDDLSREVYGVLGIPIDALDLSAVVHRIGQAAADDAPFLMSTPNLNFLVSSQRDQEFRESLLQSDLCPVDGVPIVWISRLLGIPIRERVAGSDIFDRLKTQQAPPAKVFLFGGPEGVAETASRVLNAQPGGVICVGTLYPGYGSIEEMSNDSIIETINTSGAKFLVASLGAQKGQAWLLHNHHRLKVPVRSHLGAAINFQAGLLKRAPLFVRRFGLEWLWRIKQEPYLWRRYFGDGRVLLSLMLKSVFPLAFGRALHRLGSKAGGLKVSSYVDGDAYSIVLAGTATRDNVADAIPIFRDAVTASRQLTVDLSKLRSIDARFFGLLLMARKQLRERGGRLQFAGVTPRLEKAFRLNRFSFLLPSGDTSSKSNQLQSARAPSQ
jgi:N-acetylglucosaminyldiphosphoundecaprenol N-acetyl-beta-D-mannosaminyltransferase